MKSNKAPVPGYILFREVNSREMYYERSNLYDDEQSGCRVISAESFSVAATTNIITTSNYQTTNDYSLTSPLCWLK